MGAVASDQVVGGNGIQLPGTAAHRGPDAAAGLIDGDQLGSLLDGASEVGDALAQQGLGLVLGKVEHEAEA